MFNHNMFNVSPHSQANRFDSVDSNASIDYSSHNPITSAKNSNLSCNHEGVFSIVDQPNNSLTQDVDLSYLNHVTDVSVTKLLRNSLYPSLYNISEELRAFGITADRVSHLSTLPCMKEINRQLLVVDSIISVMTTQRTIVTVCDIDDELRLSVDKKEIVLCLPAYVYPQVQSAFNISDQHCVYDLRASDVIDVICRMSNKKSKTVWEIIDHVSKAKNIPPERLGLKINNLGLLLKTCDSQLAKVSSSFFKLTEREETKFGQKVSALYKDHLKNLKHETATKSTDSLAKKFSSAMERIKLLVTALLTQIDRTNEKDKFVNYRDIITACEVLRRASSMPSISHYVALAISCPDKYSNELFKQVLAKPSCEPPIIDLVSSDDSQAAKRPRLITERKVTKKMRKKARKIARRKIPKTKCCVEEAMSEKDSFDVKGKDKPEQGKHLSEISCQIDFAKSFPGVSKSGHSFARHFQQEFGRELQFEFDALKALPQWNLPQLSFYESAMCPVQLRDDICDQIVGFPLLSNVTQQLGVNSRFLLDHATCPPNELLVTCAGDVLKIDCSSQLSNVAFHCPRNAAGLLVSMFVKRQEFCEFVDKFVDGFSSMHGDDVVVFLARVLYYVPLLTCVVISQSVVLPVLLRLGLSSQSDKIALRKEMRRIGCLYKIKFVGHAVQEKAWCKRCDDDDADFLMLSGQEALSSPACEEHKLQLVGASGDGPEMAVVAPSWLPSCADEPNVPIPPPSTDVVHSCEMHIECLRKRAAAFSEDVAALIERCMRHLSANLYADPVHCLFELIQNADDNSYGSQVPRVEFRLLGMSLFILNNENGMTSDDVEALCSLNSTKKLSDSSKIGHKGLGFKSVFKVTDTPALHSGGYHIKFDAKEACGLITPALCMPSSQALEFIKSWSTVIELPFRDDGTVQLMKDALAQLKPSVLLFCNKLRSLSYYTDSSQCNLQVLSRSGDFVSLAENQVCRVWQKTTTAIDHRDEQLQLTVAIPLQCRDVELSSLFCFLPVMPGFPFVVNAPFDLTSSRESILTDSVRNQLFLSGVAPLFVDAIDRLPAALETLPASEMGYSAVWSAKIVLSCLPSTEYSHPHLLPACIMIMSLLRSKPCVLCSDGQLRKPSAVVIVPSSDALLGSVSDKNVIQLRMSILASYGIYPVHTALEEFTDPLRRLGVEELKAAKLCKILLRKSSVMKINDFCTLMEWLSLLEYTSLIPHLRELPLPIAGCQDRHSLQSASQQLHVEAECVEFFDIVRDCFWLIDFGSSQSLRSMLLMCGAIPITHGSITKELIRQLKLKPCVDQQRCIAAVKFFILSGHNPSADLDPPLATTIGLKRPNEHHVYFPRAYGGKIDMESLHNSCNLSFLTDDYLLADKTHLALSFLKKVGVSDGVKVIRVSRQPAFLKHLIQEQNAITSISDVVCSDIVFTSDCREMQALFRALHSDWERLSLDGTYVAGGFVKTFRSTLQRQLLETAWIPVAGEQKLVRPGQAHLPTQEILGLPASCLHVIDVDEDVRKPSQFSKFLGICESLADMTLCQTKELLLHWKGCQQKLTLSQAALIYSRCFEEMEKKDLKELFSSNALVFTPNVKVTDHGTAVDGVFRSLSELYMEASAVVERNAYASLGFQSVTSIYPQLAATFEKLSVRKMPNALQYLSILRHCCTRKSVEDFWLLMKDLCSFEEPLDIIKSSLHCEKLLPGSDNNWHCSDECFYQDDVVIKHLLNIVTLAKFPRSMTGMKVQLQDLLRKLGIHPVTSQISSKMCIQHPLASTDLQNAYAVYLRVISSALARDYPDVTHELEKNVLLLGDVKCFQVSELSKDICNADTVRKIQLSCVIDNRTCYSLMQEGWQLALQREMALVYSFGDLECRQTLESVLSQLPPLQTCPDLTHFLFTQNLPDTDNSQKPPERKPTPGKIMRAPNVWPPASPSQEIHPWQINPVRPFLLPSHEVLHVPQSVRDEAAAEACQNFGRRGELFVQKLLTDMLAKKMIFSVEYVNGAAESGLPYDFVVKEKVDGGEILIEVKSTSGNKVHVSAAQLELAFSLKQNYHLYIVKQSSNSSQTDCLKYKNLYQKLKDKLIDCYFEMV